MSTAKHANPQTNVSSNAGNRADVLLKLRLLSFWHIRFLRNVRHIRALLGKTVADATRNFMFFIFCVFFVLIEKNSKIYAPRRLANMENMRAPPCKLCSRALCASSRPNTTPEKNNNFMAIQGLACLTFLCMALPTLVWRQSAAFANMALLYKYIYIYIHTDIITGSIII